jgi:hypothetical protein
MDTEVKRLQRLLAIEKKRSAAANERAAIEKKRAAMEMERAAKLAKRVKRLEAGAATQSTALLKIRLEAPEDDQSLEHQLLTSAFSIANVFMSVPNARDWLNCVGVTAVALRRFPHRGIFVDPYECFKDHEENDQYAYAWVNQLLHGHHTIAFDLGLLKRFRELSGIDTPEAKQERDLIIVFLGMKTIHEGSHLGFRDTYPDLLIYGRTPKGMHGGETGNFVELHIFGGVVSFGYRGEGRWDGSQKIIGLFINGRKISQCYIVDLISECAKRKPDPVRILPVIMGAAQYKLGTDERIQSAAAADDGGGEPDFISLGDGCFLVSENRCGVRFIGTQPTRLNFDAAVDVPALSGGSGRAAKRRRLHDPAGRPAADAAAPARASRKGRGSMPRARRPTAPAVGLGEETGLAATGAAVAAQPLARCPLDSNGLQ